MPNPNSCLPPFDTSDRDTLPFKNDTPPNSHPQRLTLFDLCTAAETLSYQLIRDSASTLHDYDLPPFASEEMDASSVTRFDPIAPAAEPTTHLVQRRRSPLPAPTVDPLLVDRRNTDTSNLSPVTETLTFRHVPLTPDSVPRVMPSKSVEHFLPGHRSSSLPPSLSHNTTVAPKPSQLLAAALAKKLAADEELDLAAKNRHRVPSANNIVSDTEDESDASDDVDDATSSYAWVPPPASDASPSWDGMVSPAALLSYAGQVVVDDVDAMVPHLADLPAGNLILDGDASDDDADEADDTQPSTTATEDDWISSSPVSIDYQPRKRRHDELDLDDDLCFAGAATPVSHAALHPISCPATPPNSPPRHGAASPAAKRARMAEDEGEAFAVAASTAEAAGGVCGKELSRRLVAVVRREVRRRGGAAMRGVVRGWEVAV
ncbi:hypothetical protein HDU96_007446 [Phlyctochytrium bullatum]|nr:hypothetical protein HDU96_007446 [Phlyctochytrium bullatum]